MFIQIAANPDGSHAFQIGGEMQDGWAFVPEDMALPATFPFVNLEAALVTHTAVTETREDGEEIVIFPAYTQMEVSSMTEGVEIPQETEPELSVYDELAAAYSEGVQSA